jgi:uncharacterized protein (DUF952 family)
LIQHITTAAAWEAARADGSYRGDTLETEGFIHCSEPHQVADVAESFYKGRDGLVLLDIDPAKVTPEIKYEGGFPHIYGPLNVDAVTGARPLPRP